MFNFLIKLIFFVMMIGIQFVVEKCITVLTYNKAMLNFQINFDMAYMVFK